LKFPRSFISLPVTSMCVRSFWPLVKAISRSLNWGVCQVISPQASFEIFPSVFIEPIVIPHLRQNHFPLICHSTGHISYIVIFQHTIYRIWTNVNIVKVSPLFQIALNNICICRNLQYHVRCSGWSYTSWQGPFYPQNLTNSGWLNYYSYIFDYVEIDSSFYRVPIVFMVNNWNTKTPRDFKCTAKFPPFCVLFSGVLLLLSICFQTVLLVASFYFWWLLKCNINGLYYKVIFEIQNKF
jgi:hypothetical protein